MSNHPNSRKRAAPGPPSILSMQQQQALQQQALQQQRPQQMAQSIVANGAADQMVKWNGGQDNMNMNNFDPSGVNSFDLLAGQTQFAQNLSNSNNSLARRPMNRALVPTSQRSTFDAPISWNDFVTDETSLIAQNQDEGVNAQDSLDALEEMAQKAKRDAQGKRKQIPPFVQKLSSFLEEGKNEELIRWSEKGDSFIVLDEEEFAKTLIPELFKHNNYASFVRQLNMYGFHKRVGLSDNSMRASERKNKSPSEYSNPYFRRGHPNLLWLINKPKSGSKGKKNAKISEGDVDSEEDGISDDVHGQGLGGSHGQGTRSLPSTESQASRGKEMTLIRDEINQVRDQQKLIMRTLQQLQQHNASLYNQAMLFQSQHERHQNSINAILNFLANLFKKSLEEQGNTQSVGDIISSMIASQTQQTPQHANIVELGNLFQSQFSQSSPMGGGHPHKRARGLLPPIPDSSSSNSHSHSSHSNKNSNNSRSIRSSTSGRSSSYHSVGHGNTEMGQITELLDGSPTETPPNLHQELDKNPQERMMRIINDHNASRSSGMDLPEATEFIASAPNTLNQDQRNSLANFMAQQTSSPTTAASSTAHSTPRTVVHQSQVSPQQQQRQQQHPQRQQQQQPKQAVFHTKSPPTQAAPTPSLSPILHSPAANPLSMQQLSTNQEELDHLQRLQSQSDAKINELANMLVPLSPSPGRIMMGDHGDDSSINSNGNNNNTDQFFDTASNVDFNDYFDFDSSALENAAFDTGPAAPDFDVDFGAGGAMDAMADDSGYHHGVPSPTGTEEITREEFGMDDFEGGSRGSKRRRVD